jgi:hypothetical protein
MIPEQEYELNSEEDIGVQEEGPIASKILAVKNALYLNELKAERLYFGGFVVASVALAWLFLQVF